MKIRTYGFAAHQIPGGNDPNNHIIRAASDGARRLLILRLIDPDLAALVANPEPLRRIAVGELDKSRHIGEHLVDRTVAANDSAGDHLARLENDISLPNELQSLPQNIGALFQRSIIDSKRRILIRKPSVLFFQRRGFRLQLRIPGGQLPRPIF